MEPFFYKKEVVLYLLTQKDIQDMLLSKKANT